MYLKQSLHIFPGIYAYHYIFVGNSFCIYYLLHWMNYLVF